MNRTVVTRRVGPHVTVLLLETRDAEGVTLTKADGTVNRVGGSNQTGCPACIPIVSKSRSSLVEEFTGGTILAMTPA